MASSASVPGVAQPGLMSPGNPGSSPAQAPPAAVFTLGSPYFRWAAEEPYLA